MLPRACGSACDIYAHHGYEEQQCSTLSIEGDEPGFEMKELQRKDHESDGGALSVLY